ncbi:hypothetical protein BY996DRAFT_6594569 [Phakopsora pachyrhizi]|nr:hypothetical protein BY996DRAFT_6594569 [Phakopsora pachyrhizi]
MANQDNLKSFEELGELKHNNLTRFKVFQIIPERGFQIKQSLKDWKEPGTLLEGVEIINGNWSRRRKKKKKKKKKTARGASTTMRKSLSLPGEDHGTIHEDDEEEEDFDNWRKRKMIKDGLDITTPDDGYDRRPTNRDKKVGLNEDQFQWVVVIRGDLLAEVYPEVSKWMI